MIITRVMCILLLCQTVIGFNEFIGRTKRTVTPIAAGSITGDIAAVFWLHDITSLAAAMLVRVYRSACLVRLFVCRQTFIYHMICYMSTY